MDSPLLSIVIVSYNARSLLHACLASVTKQIDLPHETIVIDNASDDGSADMVAQEHPWAVLVRNVENLGFSPANNAGMRMARGRYILLLNPDTVVLPGSIDAWIEAHQRTSATISGTRLLGPDRKRQESAWRIPGLLDSFLELFFLHRLFTRQSYPRALFDGEVQVGFVSGAAMLAERSTLVNAGGLDPAMFWLEDADLCLRIRKAGGTCWYLNGPGIVHVGGGSSARNMDRVIANQLLSRMKFIRKHGSNPAFAGMVCVIVLHAATRAAAFGVLSLFRKEPRASAYRHAWRRVWRYLLLNDASI